MPNQTSPTHTERETDGDLSSPLSALANNRFSAFAHAMGERNARHAEQPGRHPPVRRRSRAALGEHWAPEHSRLRDFDRRCVLGLERELRAVALTKRGREICGCGGFGHVGFPAPIDLQPARRVPAAILGPPLAELIHRRDRNGKMTLGVSRSTPAKPGGVTPMIVYCAGEIVMVVPSTSGDPAYRDIQ